MPSAAWSRTTTPKQGVGEYVMVKRINFMAAFGPLSSLFDFATFGVLLLVLHAQEDLFRTGWFVESVISASLVVLVVRTRRPFFRSLPGRALLAATLGIVVVTLVLPFTPLGKLFGFVPLSGTFLALRAALWPSTSCPLKY
jgi:Mg2+-importing ATPase